MPVSYTHLDVYKRQGSKLGVFCTGPSVENKPLNILSEAIGTFVLVFAIKGLANVPGAAEVGLDKFLRCV